jgi:hypothetical protein
MRADYYAVRGDLDLVIEASLEPAYLGLELRRVSGPILRRFREVSVGRKFDAIRCRN